MIYLDITRLLNRLEVLSPTGMDRVEFEYAQHGLRSGWGFVGQDADHIAQIPTWLAEQVIEFLRHRWGNGAEDNPWLTCAIRIWRKTVRPPSNNSDTQAFFRDIRSRSFIDRLPVVYKAKADISKRAPFIPADISVLAVASLPILFDYLFTPKQPPESPTFRVNPTFGSSVYLNVAHAGLEKSKLMRMLKTRQDVTIVAYVHDLLPMTHPHLFPEKDLSKHATRLKNIKDSASAILVNSNFTKEQFEEHFGAGSVRGVLEIGTPAAPARSWANHQRNGFVAIGTIEPRKNYIWLVKAWLEFARAHPDHVQDERLTIFGKPGWLPEESNQELLSLIESSDNVEIVSGASDERVLDRLASARAYVTAAEVEGWGMPLAEALGIGTPVIATDIPAHREVTQGCGRFYAHDNVEDFLVLLRDCFDADAYREMITEVSKFQPWSWSSHFGRLENVLHSI